MADTLTSCLLASGYNVSILSRPGQTSEKTNVFKWDPDKRMIDPEAFEGCDFIIHLAGANITEVRDGPGREKRRYLKAGWIQPD